MRFIELTQPERQEISVTQIQGLNEPYMIFLGGLLHVQDIDTKKNLPGYLRKLRGNNPGRIFMVLDETVTATGPLSSYMEAYGNNQASPSDFMRDVYDALMRPHVAATDLSSPEQRQALKQKLSHIGLLGYSYGTSLIQQLGEIAIVDITEAHNQQGIYNPGIGAADICAAVKAINIGPVAKFKHVDENGNVAMLEPSNPYHDHAMTVFSQMSFLMRDDKIVQRSYGHDMLGDVFASETGIEVRDTMTTTTYIDYVGLPGHAAIGIFRLNDGQKFPKVITAYDYMLHDLRTYMNVREVQGDLAVYPSFAIAPILRTAAASMLNGNETGAEWRARLQEQFSSPENRDELVKDFRAQRATFDEMLARYQESLIQDAIPMLEAHVESLRQGTMAPRLASEFSPR